MFKSLSLTGLLINGMAVMDRIPRPYDAKDPGTYYRCLCHCGNLFNAHGASLKVGLTRSCGCLNGTRQPARVKPTYQIKQPNTPIHKGVNLTLSTKLDLWAKKVKADKTACERCGNESNLHTHHIQAGMYKPELLLDPNNGIVLCKQCHETYHKIYGHKYNCNYQTLFEYINRNND